MRSLTIAILLTTAVIALAPLSASAQQIDYSKRLTYAPVLPPKPVWGPPPTPKGGYHEGPRPTPQLRNDLHEHRAQDRIFERLAHCALDLTPDQRLRDCSDI